jgi:hypothetical protein
MYPEQVDPEFGGFQTIYSFWWIPDIFSFWWILDYFFFLVDSRALSDRFVACKPVFLL